MKQIPDNQFNSLDYSAPMMDMTLNAGEISDEVDLGTATDLIMRPWISVVIFPYLAVAPKAQRVTRVARNRCLHLGGPALA